jgi:hypothetical protein
MLQGSIQPFLTAPGIRFNDSVFTEPVRIAGWIPPSCAGIMAILARDPNWAPKPFQPLYFGEFGNNGAHAFVLAALAGSSPGADLFVSVLPMPFSTTAQRHEIRNALISAYNPICQANSPGASTAELARKLDELESRQKEQNAQILALLSHVNKSFEPQPAGPRRSIGFLPPALLSEPAPATGIGS